MPNATTIRVTSQTRDELRRLAASEGLTMEETIRRLVRTERQRRIGVALAAHQTGSDDEAWLDVGPRTISTNDRP